MKRTSNVVHDASGRNGHTARSHASVAWRIAVALMLCLPAGTVPISTASANDAPPKETAPTVAADAPAGSSDIGAPPPLDVSEPDTLTAPEESAKAASEPVSAMTAAPISFAAANEPAPRAGRNIKLELAWDETTKNLSGTTANDDGTHLTRSASNSADFSLKYRLHISLDAAQYAKDEVVVRIPMILGSYRDDSQVTLKSSDIGIGTDPDKATTEAPFYYEVVGDDCVIRNARELNQALSTLIEVWFPVDPVKVADMSTAKITATGTCPDGVGGELTASAAPLEYTLDTKVELSGVSLTGKPFYDWTSIGGDMSKPSSGYELDVVHNRYILYTAKVDTPDSQLNQPYTLKLKLDALSAEGTVFYASCTNNTIFDPTDGSLNYTATETTTKSKTYLGKPSRKYCFLVAYPRHAGESDTATYQATLIGTVTPSDGKDPITEKTTTNTLNWKDYRFDYTKKGEIFNLKKTKGVYGSTDGFVRALTYLDNDIDASGLNYTLTGTAQYYPKTGDPQYPDEDDQKRVGMTLIDDLMYLHGKDAAVADMARLDSDDYRYENISVAVTNKLTNRVSGTTDRVSNLSKQYPGIMLSVSYKTKSGGDVWSTPTEYGFKTYSYVNNIPFPEDAYAVKIELPPMLRDDITVELKLSYTMKHDSPTYASVRKRNDPAQDTLVLSNFGGLLPSVANGTLETTLSENDYGSDSKDLGLPAHDWSAYGQYILRASAGGTLTGLDSNSNFGKFATGGSETDAGTAFIEYQMEAAAGYTSSITQSEYDSLIAQGMPSASLDTAVFYDLLPRGASLATDAGHAPTATRLDGYDDSARASCPVTVSVENNYRGTGRQMVKLEVSSGLAEGKNVSNGFLYHLTSKDDDNRMSGKVSGFSVKLWMAVPFTDAGLVNGSKNNAAFQTVEGAIIGDGGARSDARHPDTGESSVLEDLKDESGTSVFYNLAERPDGPDTNLLNTMYSADTVNINQAISYGDGLSNTVKSDSFIDDVKYSSSASVLLGQPYLYRLSLTSGSKQISNAILFNNFGQASVGGETSSWNGTLEKIDLENAILKGIAPVVYYTTTAGAPYFTTDDIDGSTVPTEWNTAKPANLADVKGIAVDLSHSSTGASYAIPMSQSIGVYVTMRAPSTLPSPDAVEYNQAAYYAKIGGDVHLPGDSTLSAPAVETRLIAPALVKSNAPAYDTWVAAGYTITYTLSYTNEASETHPLVIEDGAPAGTSLAPAASGGLAGNPAIEVGGTTVANAATVDEAAGTVQWKANVAPGDTATATFQVTIDADAEGVIENKGDAAVRDAATHTNTAFSSNTVQNRITPMLSKAVTGGTHGTDAAVYPGDTLTYELRYKNTTLANQKVSITDTAPANTTLTGGTGNPTINVTGTPSAVGNKITWDIPELKPGEEAVVTFQVTVDSNVAAGNAIANTGTVAVDDGSVTVDSNEVTTPVDPKPAPTKAVAGGTGAGGRAYPGDVLTYTLAYENKTASAQKVVVRDAAPAGTSLTGTPWAKVDGVAVTGAAVVSGSDVEWTFDSLAAGSRVEVAFQVMVAESAANTDIANTGGVFLDNSTVEHKTNEVTTPADPKPAPTKTVAGGSGTSGRAFPGDVLTYTISYTNASKAVQDIVVRDKAPAGTHLVAAEGGGLAGAPTAKVDGVEVAGAAALEGGSLTWTFNSVGAGLAVEATFQVVVDGAAAGSDVANTGGVFLNSSTVEHKTNEVTTPVDPTPPVVPDPDPAPTKTVTGGTVETGGAYPGDVLVYQLRYTNESSAGQNITLVDAAPDGTTLVEGASGKPAGLPEAMLDGVPLDSAASVAGSQITWTFADVPAGSTVVVSFSVTVNDRDTSATVKNTGVLHHDGKSFATNEVTTPVEPTPPAPPPVVPDPTPTPVKSVDAASKHPTDGRAYPGDVLTYAIEYANESSNAQAVVIKDAAPSGTSLVPAENGVGEGAPQASLDGNDQPNASTTDADGTITWSFVDVPAGSRVRVSFKVVVDEAASGSEVANTGSLFLNGGTVEYRTNETVTPVDPNPPVVDPDPDPPVVDPDPPVVDPDPPVVDPDPDPPVVDPDPPVVDPDPPVVDPDPPVVDPMPDPEPPANDPDSSGEQNPAVQPLDKPKAVVSSERAAPPTGDALLPVLAGLTALACVALVAVALAQRRMKRSNR